MIGISILEDRFDKIKAEGKEGKEKLKELHSEIQGYIEEAVNKQKAIDGDRNNLMVEMDANPLSKEEKLEATTQLLEMRNKSREWCEYSSALSKLQKRIESQINRIDAFDKELFIKNMRFLLKDRNIRLGDIEDKADVRIGYLSMLEKEGSLTEPSIRFLRTAAKMLNVTIDDLVNYDVTEISEQDMKVKQFLSAVLSDTQKGCIHWDKLDLVGGRVRQGCEKVFYDKMFDSYSDTDSSKRIFSKFTRNFVILVGNSYHVLLENINAELYMFKCRQKHEGKRKLTIVNEEFFEVYLIDKSEANPICTSLNSIPEILALINELYKEANSNFGKVYLNEATRNLMDSYINHIN